MKNPQTEQIEQSSYDQGCADTETVIGSDMLLARIERAQAFRQHSGRRLRPNVISRLGLGDLMSIN